MRSAAAGKFPIVGQNVDSPFLRGAKDISSRKGETRFKEGIKYTNHDPLSMYLNLRSGFYSIHNVNSCFGSPPK
jgi:E3 ubiquitin-protein ligase HOS1